MTAFSVDDTEIRAAIRRDAHELGYIWCPHTATAAEVYRRLRARGSTAPWVIVATAHPAKFNDIVEPGTGQPVPVPPSLAALLTLPRVETDLEPTVQALRSQLYAWIRCPPQIFGRQRPFTTKSSGGVCGLARS